MMYRPTPHYYLALAGFGLAVVMVPVTLWAYYDERIISSEIAFALGALTDGVLFFTWFWGMYLLMSGLFPQGHALYLTVHAATGSVIPLLYTISLGLQMETLATQPLGETQVALSVAALLVLTVQVMAGRTVFRRYAGAV